MINDDNTPLEFPCRFGIKAMGSAEGDFASLVTELVQARTEDAITKKDVAQRDSRTGRYISVTVTITAQSRAQLDAIYRDLHAHPDVVMTL